MSDRSGSNTVPLRSTSGVFQSTDLRITTAPAKPSFRRVR